MSSFIPAPERLALVYTKLGWPVEPIAQLLADPTGPALPFDRAYDLAWMYRRERVALDIRPGQRQSPLRPAERR